MDSTSYLPMHFDAHDTLRNGLCSLKYDAAPKHPVEIIQMNSKNDQLNSRTQMLKDIYGAALPARMHLENQILSKFHRLPGIPSSNLGLEVLNGDLDDFTFESFIGLPEDHF
mmetsp:Transcript_28315/g.52136  ORF Transcript_28315/g.52136 Transcript_28315/m.52136 type:complete len:112 (-) Transcript_28315:170-505(-)|eukprot:CAMPEP_0175078754 /NCGR_PEP_ID=MMETSP0052_2-20121109/24344_1 /TAXON_ID=51329 ORGANISM="Polytomella parva, Strain SAG 63-3" /NCGR_SAMPLE_ID=MMETSP0052_2 /ASSEMBLY_ACC=CAM_ASM_000194 /LENGTH=111 /DNA_ID=CAMNT_0016348811 /DNA_START=63 /DNA_END=401 /DNA_ORIENTATION=+